MGRYIRKRVGMPASHDIAALAGALSKLKEQTNSFLGSHRLVKFALVTIPFLLAVYLEDLVDAAEHVQVQLLMLPSYIHRYSGANEWPVSELNSAFAGNCLGVDYMNSKDGWG
jgi:hypothetical protein